MARKPPPSAVLKTLDDDIQAEIFEALQTQTLEQGVEWLAVEKGIKTNKSSLGDWRGWYALNRSIGTWEAEVDELKAALEKTGTDPDLIPKLGEAVFLAKAAKTGDVKAFATVAAITQRHVELRSRQDEHSDKMKIADKRLKIQAADLERKNKELQSRLDEAERQRKAAEAAMLKANKDGGMTDETVRVIREALGMKVD